MPSVDELLLRIDATSEGLRRELKRTEQSVQGSSTRINRKVRTIDKAFASLGRVAKGALVSTIVPAAAIGGLTLLARNAIMAADAIAKTADKLGVTTDTLQEFRFAASRAGVSVNAADMGLQRLARRAGDAARGVTEAQKTFSDLGVSVFDLEGNMRSTEDIIDDVSDAIAGMDSDAARLSATVKLVDSEAAGLVNVFKQGSAALNETRRAARRLGVVIDEDLIRKGEAAGDVLGDLSTIISANVNTVLLEMAPLIADVAKKFAEAAPEIRKFIQETFGLGEAGAKKEFDAFFDAASRRVDGLITQIEESRRLIDISEKLVVGRGQKFADQSAFVIAEERQRIETALAEIVEIHKEVEEAAKKLEKSVTPAGARTSSAGTPSSPEDEKAAAAAKKQRDAVIKSLEFESDQLYRTSQQQAIYNNLRSAGIELGDAYVTSQGQVIGKVTEEADAIIVLTQAQVRAKKAREEFNEQEAKAKQIYEETRKPEEEHKERLDDLDKLLRDGAITQETYERAVKNNNETLRDANAQNEILTGGIEDLSRVLADGEASWEDLGRVAVDVLTGIITKLLETGDAAGGLGSLFGGGSGVGTAGGGGGGVLGPILSGIFGGASGGIGGGLGFFAKGGVMTNRGSVPLRKYAAGGIATSPQVSVFGEGSRAEAYVPLPDGRSIPVSMSGGGGGSNFTYSPTFNIDARGAERGVSAEFEVVKREIVADAVKAVEAHANKGGSFARAVGRRR